MRARPELTREQLLLKIEGKKKTVGAGFLTDQGALFLVAGEMGVPLNNDASSELRIGDLYVGANDVTVLSRVLAVYPVASYGKKDGSQGRYRRFVLFDGRETIRFTVWEDKLEEVDGLGLSPDCAVRVIGGYVKQGLDGKPNLNLGRAGRIEPVRDEGAKSLASLAMAAEKLGPISEERQFVAVELVVTAEPRYSEFVRSDGSKGSLLQFGASAGGDNAKTRVVIWNPSTKASLVRGQKVVITNTRSKRSQSGSFELHGDAGSAVTVGQSGPKVELRVAAVKSDGERNIVFAIGKDKRVVVIEMGTTLVPMRGDLVAVSPEAKSGGTLVYKSAMSMEVGVDSKFPRLEALNTKISEVDGEGSTIMVEVIALSRGSVDEVRLKDGTAAVRGELVVGDDTGEMKLVAWRDLSQRVEGIRPGERLMILGAVPKLTKMNAWILELGRLSVIEKLGQARP